MALSYLKAAFVAGFAATAAMAMPTQQAKAMDVGQCFSAPEMRQHLQDERQQKIALGDEPAVNPKPGAPLFEMRAFTTDADGNGYILSGNLPKRFASTEICVSVRLKNVKIFDARVPGVDPKALVHEDPVKAERQCQTSGSALCNLHSTALANSDRDGYRVMMQGTRMARQPDGTYKPGDLVTLTGQMQGDKKGMLSHTSPEGAFTLATTFANVAYSEYAIKTLEDERSDGRVGSDRRFGQTAVAN
jgi:hypothetical protein